MAAEKSFTLRLANGKEESFVNGEEMYNWFLRESQAARTDYKEENKKNNKKRTAKKVVDVKK